MPELPEVQTTVTSLTPLIGQKITNICIFQPKLRWQMPDDLSDLLNFELKCVERRAKYLILTFTDQVIEKKLIIHLGMSGSLQQHSHGFQVRKHDHLLLEFSDNKATTQLHYHDPRRFGAVLWHDEFADKLLNHLGVEPLSHDFTAVYLYKTIHERKQAMKRPIKAVIMEQAIVVGVGNIYATESLFLCKIHPLTPANLLSYQQLSDLVRQIRKILQTAIEKGGSTLKDFSVGAEKAGYFQQTLNVYSHKDKPCPICQTPIESVKIAQRASNFCPNCQPLPNIV
ncbi:formamidopyrimidine/5-formyluracil/ 5-hydroxymethyluracil DNA glycosylase [Moraxella macacae 0408225]|uniref:Formamidopyrimidine-DNA glycosylase n=1 Tax=Moraxella macacae 0408225 TaxID=1230338 RepID=L2F755_9GAMM|nr:bifunctional DNA-formamidopyrimidine glycosylase/DNA-(apurinic or apyrimidinic site) lyase [Moraxella macacae]ELA08872.1 formamidopyrimidine/5-formyluracil/ 5-hydroxymethyluracil DNA glycosylase [Moraxella macacae 0408225]